MPAVLLPLVERYGFAKVEAAFERARGFPYWFSPSLQDAMATQKQLEKEQD